MPATPDLDTARRMLAEDTNVWARWDAQDTRALFDEACQEIHRLTQDILKLNRRMWPDQGHGYANEVERQRVVIDHMRCIAENASTATVTARDDANQREQWLLIAEQKRIEAEATIARIQHVLDGWQDEQVRLQSTTYASISDFLQHAVDGETSDAQ
jgi:hypothetical protein